MITIDDFKRLIMPIKNKIFLLLGRAILTAVNNAESTQKVQLGLLQNEVITDLEHLQSYGFEHYPKPGAEALSVFLNGNRSQGIVVVIHDRRYRPQDLVEGEVSVYTDEDKTVQDNRIHLKRGKIHQHKSNQHLVDALVKAVFTSPLFQADVNQHHINAVVEAIFTAPLFQTNTSQHLINAAIEAIFTTLLFRVTGGTVELASQGALKKLVNEEFITLFNGHVHSGVSAGLVDSGIPTVSAGASEQTINTKAS